METRKAFLHGLVHNSWLAGGDFLWLSIKRRPQFALGSVIPLAFLFPVRVALAVFEENSQFGRPRGMNTRSPEVNELRTVGSTALFQIVGAPPARRNTNIALPVCINSGRICISAMWDRTDFTQQDCREFLELYKIGWQQWCEAEESSVGVYAEPETV